MHPLELLLPQLHLSLNLQPLLFLDLSELMRLNDNLFFLLVDLRIYDLFRDRLHSPHFHIALIDVQQCCKLCVAVVRLITLQRTHADV